MTALPPGWRLTTLNEVAAAEPRAITDGPFGSNLTSAHYTAFGPRVVRLQNIGDGQFVDNAAHISQAHYEKLASHQVLGGDLLIASLGQELPRACIAPDWLGPAIVKADCIRVRLGPVIEPRWALYAMQLPATRNWATEQLHGVGRPRLGLKVIRAIPMPLPPIGDQRRIVDILEDHLSRLDAATLYTARALARADSLVRSILLDAVPERGRPAWRLVSVAEAGAVDLGRQRHPDWHNGPNMRPYLRVANVFEDRIDTTDIMSMDFTDVFDRFRLSDGDVLLNEGQSPHLLGRPAIYRGVPPEVAFTNSILRFRANDDVLPEWALLVFRRHMHAGRFTRESRITTNIAHLSAKRFKSVEFPLPSLDEQRRLVGLVNEQLANVDRLRSAAIAAQARSNGLRRSLLRAAFSGELTGRTSNLNRVEEAVG